MEAAIAPVTLPPLQDPGECPVIAEAEYRRRLGDLYTAAAADWVVVYADREHYANLAYLTGVDPRFEETLLLLGPAGRRILVAGNEMPQYALSRAPWLDVVEAQTFGLMGQDRTRAPRLREALVGAGLRPGQSVGVAGWKYLLPAETDDPRAPAFVPAMVVREIQAATGTEPFDVTSILMDPAVGLRSVNTAAQIAVFEWAATRASAAVWRIVEASRPGMTELQVAAEMGYAGEPLSCHVMLSSSGGEVVGLRSPTGRSLETGDAMSTAVGYWGSLACRAGQLSSELDEAQFRLSAAYFGSIAALWQTLAIGVSGAELWDAAVAPLASAGLRSALNPGHLISYEEWLHSPVQPGSAVRIRSGMVLQTDIIPVPLPRGTALNCEDTLAIADEQLRDDLRRLHPGAWGRIEGRRAAIADDIGLELAPEVLPLSDRAAFFAPAWLAPDRVLSVRRPRARRPDRP